MDAFHLHIQGKTRTDATREQCEKFLLRCPEVIGMKRYGAVNMEWFAGGWSGVQYIEQSAIMLHAIGDNLWLDVFSCKDFDEDVAKTFALGCFHFDSWTCEWLDRSIDDKPRRN